VEDTSAYQRPLQRRGARADAKGVAGCGRPDSGEPDAPGRGRLRAPGTPPGDLMEPSTFPAACRNTFGPKREPRVTLRVTPPVRIYQWLPGRSVNVTPEGERTR